MDFNNWMLGIGLFTKYLHSDFYRTLMIENYDYFSNVNHSKNITNSYSWITDGSGNVYAERRRSINQTSTSWDARYKFTGKERDAETGFVQKTIGIGASPDSCAGYDSDLSIWLSVDPLASDFPNISPYNYVEQNPVKYIDEEGKNPIGAIIGAAVGGVKEIASQTISNGFTNLENGEGFFKGWSDNMDWADVGISTVEGTLAGLTMGASLGVTLAIEGGAAVARSSIDWKGDDKTPSTYYKDKYRRRKSLAEEDIIFGEVLPPVEIYPPSHEKASQNSSIMRKKYQPWLQK